METDDVRIVALGTVLWVVALIAALVFHDRLAEHDNGDWVWVALAGVFLGFVGLRHVRRLRQTPSPEQGARSPQPDAADRVGGSGEQ
jgi:Protein of unknown function (DUF2530)